MIRQKWEYDFQCVSPSATTDDVFRMLNRWGDCGWELVSMGKWTYYFKRPKVDQITRTRRPTGKMTYKREN